MKRTTLRLTIFAAAIAAFLTVAVSALGATRPDNRAGIRGVEADAVVRVLGVKLTHHIGFAVRPDDRGGMLGVGR